MIDDGYGDQLTPAEVQVTALALFEQHERLLRRLRVIQSVARRDPHLAEDILQEARVAAWRALEAGERDTSRILERARQRALSVLTGDKPPLGAERYTETERRRATNGYAKGNETRQRMREFIEAFQHEHGRPPMQREIAVAVGIAEPAVRKHLAKLYQPTEPTEFRSTSLDLITEPSEWGQQAIPEPLRVQPVHQDLAAHHDQIASAINALADLDRAYVVYRFWGDQTHPEIARRVGRPKSTVDRRWAEVIRPELAERLAHLAGAA